MQNEINQPHTFRGIYYLESENSGMNPIAIRPEITPTNYVSWEDTANGRILQVAKILIDGKEESIHSDMLPEKIEIVSSKGEIFKLVKLTKKIFDEQLKNKVAGGGSLNFENDNDLQNYF